MVTKARQKFCRLGIEWYNIVMNIKIKSKDVSVSPVVEDYVFKKLSLLEKFLNPDNGALYEVELAKITKNHKSGDIYKAEVNITCAGKQFFVSVEKDDLYAAIDEVKDEAERVIVSRRKKYMAMIRRGSKKIKDLIKSLYE